MTANQDLPIQAADILVVDDSIASLRMLTEILTKAGYEPRPAEDPQMALEAALAQPPSLILLDVKMPKMSGFELCRRLKQDERTCDVPVIFVSALEDTEDKVRGFEVGGGDFISKPVQEAEVLARVKAHLQLRYTQLHLEEMVAERTAQLEKLLAERSTALDTAEDQIRTLFESAQVGIALSTYDGALLAANPAMLGMIGYTQNEFLQLNVISLYADPDQRTVLLQQLKEQQAVRDFGVRVKHKDGTVFFASMNVSVTKRGSQDVLLVLVEDVTDKVLADAALRESEQKFRALFQAMPVPVYTWQRRGKDIVLVDHNEAADRFTQGNASKFTGWTLTAMYPDRPDIVEDIAHCLTEQVTIHREMAYTFKSTGEGRDLAVTYAPVPPELAIVQTQDITERKLLEAQLADAAARAERDRLAQDLHDSVTQGLYSASLIAETLPVVWEEEPEEAQRGLQQLERLTQGALAEMRALLLELRPAALVDQELPVLLRQLSDATMARTQTVVTTTVAGDCSMPTEVKIALYRIAQEALNNVVKHAQARQGWINLRRQGAREGPTVSLRIGDNGLGFDPEAKRSQGLGLETMRERADGIDAALTINSQPGEGTEVLAEWSAS